MNEKETLALGRVTQLNIEVLLTEPFHLVWMHTAPSLLVQAVLVPGVQEPQSERNIVAIFVIDWKIVVK